MPIQYQNSMPYETFNYSLVNNSEITYPPTDNQNHYPNYYNRYSSYVPSPIHYIYKRSPGTFGDLLRSMMPFRQPKSIRQGRHLKPNSQSSGNLPSSSSQNNPTKSGSYPEKKSFQGTLHVNW